MVGASWRFPLAVPLGILLLIVAVLPSPAVEPMLDFRGIRWGTPVSELAGMKISKKETDRLIWYSWTEKAGVEDPILNAKILYILYGFLDGKFAGAYIMPYGGHDNFKKLEWYCTVKLGKSVAIESGETLSTFSGPPGVIAFLAFDRKRNLAELTLLTDDAEEERMNHAPEGGGSSGSKAPFSE